MISSTVQDTLRECIGADRPTLFGMADKLWAPVAAERWKAWVLDYNTIHFLRLFLETALFPDGPEAAGVQVIPIANTRKMTENSPEHAQAVADYLGKRGLADASVLIVTDVVDSGSSVKRLAAPLRAAGVGHIDLVLADDYQRRSDDQLRQEFDVREVYSGNSSHGPTGYYKGLELKGSLPGKPIAHGFRTIAGEPEPQAYPCNSEMHAATSLAYQALGHEYRSMLRNA